ncbi:hypothetical protein JTB14_016130 [Gonioctena quinquepunctata]|nr:hypothetical protein JTB14_016130 [Gonioctena quinquepunctata]
MDPLELDELEDTATDGNAAELLDAMYEADEIYQSSGGKLDQPVNTRESSENGGPAQPEPLETKRTRAEWPLPPYFLGNLGENPYFDSFWTAEAAAKREELELRRRMPERQKTLARELVEKKDLEISQLLKEHCQKTGDSRLQREGATLLIPTISTDGVVKQRLFVSSSEDI